MGESEVSDININDVGRLLLPYPRRIPGQECKVLTGLVGIRHYRIIMFRFLAF